MVHYRSKSVPLVQNEMIFNNKLISQSYVPFVQNTNYNVIQTNNAQTGTVLINKTQNTITNPTKVQVLKNIENKMDNSNDLTKQKIKARAELKIIFKEIEGKELTEDENNDLKQKIKEVEKKYPNTVTEKTITKLCDNFKVKLPEENKQINENNQDYYLVHAKAIQDEEKKSQTYKEMIEQGLDSKIRKALWTRVGTHEDDCKDYEIAKKDVFTIIGHTPVNNSLINFKQGYVDIDCGISYDEQVALVNLTDGTVEYFSGESIKEKSKEKEINNEER